MVQKCYSVMFADVTGYISKQIRRKEEVRSQEGTVRDSEKKFEEHFYDHCDPGLYILRYNLVVFVMKHEKRYGIQYILDKNPYEQFKLKIRH